MVVRGVSIPMLNAPPFALLTMRRPAGRRAQVPLFSHFGLTPAGINPDSQKML